MRNFLVFSRSLILLLLIGLGIWHISAGGNEGFGIGIIAGASAAFIASMLKARKITRLQEQGMNPYDERHEYVNGKAAIVTIYIFSTVLALIVLIGSDLDPVPPAIDLYDALGLCLAGVLLLYTICYFVYSKRLG